MASTIHPPTFRLGALHTFSQEGGAVIHACDKAFDTEAGRALAACSNARRGRLVLDSDPEARWIARRGDTEHDHTPTVWWTGRARRNDTFHFGAWDDGSMVVAVTDQHTVTALPVVVRLPTPLDLGTLGNNWVCVWEHGQGRVDVRRYRSLFGGRTQRVAESGIVAFPELVPGHTAEDLETNRVAAVVRAHLLQALSDLACTIADQPPVLWPITRTPRPGWTVPPFAKTGAPPRPAAERAREVHAVLFPVVARAFVARHIVASQPAFTVEVQPARMAGDGTLTPPGLTVPDALLRAWPTTEDSQRFKADLTEAFDRALARGTLGSLLTWRDEDGHTLPVTFDPSLFSRHAILAALAPPPRAPRRTPPPPDADAPWWAEMAPPDA